MKRDRLFHWLLWLYPKRFRERYGPELRAFWSWQATESRYAGRMGRLRLHAHLIRDALAGAARERARTVAGGPGRHHGGGESGSGAFGASRSNTGVFADARWAWKSIRSTPVHALVVVLTLAIGIGSTVGIFAVVESVLLEPLPYPDADRLVIVRRTGSESGSISWPDFEDWRAQADGFEGMAAHHESATNFGWEDGAELVRGAIVSRDLFEVLGVPLQLGRTFTGEEDRLGGSDAVILSWSLWQRRFGGDPGVLDTVVRMGDASIPVVGVMPRGFSYPGEGVDYWQPLQDDEALRDAGLPTGRRTLSFLTVLARVSEDGMEVATNRLSDLAGRIDESAGIAPEQRRGVYLEPLRDTMVGDVRSTLLLFLGAVSLLLLVACANVAGLTFSRVLSRQRELAVRAALGAGRPRLVRQLLTESLILASAGGVAGVAIAGALTRLIVMVAPTDVSGLEAATTSAGSLAFGALVTLATGLAFGAMPALRFTRGRLADGLARHGRGTGADPRTLRPQNTLVVFQVSLAVALLAGAMLLVRSYVRLLAVEPGYATDGVVMVALDAPEESYAEPQAVDAFYSGLLDRVRAIPGVAAATSTYSPPLDGNGFRTTIEIEGVPEDPNARFWAGSVIVRDDYFETTGTRLLSGRDFTTGDRLGGQPVAIVNQTMADRLWPGQSPLGERFRVTDGLQGSLGRYDPRFFHDDWLTVIGVAGDVRRESLAKPPEPEYYRPHAQVAWSYQVLLVRTAGDVGPITAQMREELRQLDASIPIQSIQTIRASIHGALAAWRFRMLLLTSFGMVSCLLAMLGVYAVMTFAVARRRREMGVRMALGATASQLHASVLGRGLGLVSLGTIIGLAIATAGNGILDSMLFEITANDPSSFLYVTVTTALIAMFACWIPARRAGRVDPVRCLREE